MRKSNFYECVCTCSCMCLLCCNKVFWACLCKQISWEISSVYTDNFHLSVKQISIFKSCTFTHFYKTMIMIMLTVVLVMQRTALYLRMCHVGITILLLPLLPWILTTMRCGIRSPSSYRQKQRFRHGKS